MGLLTIIKKHKAKNREIRVLVLGLDNAGKTTIVKSWMGEDTEAVLPTMGFQIHSMAYAGHTLNIWDIGGQRTLREFWGNYYEKTNVVVWVVDAVYIERLEELAQELRTRVMQQDQVNGVHVMVLVNKMDEIEGGERARVKERVREKLQFMAGERSQIEMVSGKSGLGLEGCLQWIVSREY